MIVAFECRCNGDTRPNFWLWIIASLYDWLRSIGWICDPLPTCQARPRHGERNDGRYAAFSAAASTIRTTSAMMRFSSKSFGV